jgi:hypothetical protein
MGQARPLAVIGREGGAMSAKSVAEKLLIKPGTTVWSSDPSRLGLIGSLPAGVRRVEGPEEASTSLVFADDAATVAAVLKTYADRFVRTGNLWVAYPKANRTDINRDTLWPILAEYGLRPIGQVALDDAWSALRFRPLKDGEAPFTGGR